MGVAKFFYEQVISRLAYEATPCQKEMLIQAVDFIFSSGDDDILVVNGYAGTGKTSAMSILINVLKDNSIPVVLLAPTGRAAKVFSLYSGLPAQTIHKYIYRQKSVAEDGFGNFSLFVNKLKNAIFVVDEASLIGVDSYQNTGNFGSGNLLEDLIRFVKNGLGCKLILIGDSAQLPPVGMDSSPALSKDYMRFAGNAKFVGLNTVVRQKLKSGILENATNIRNKIENQDFFSLCLNVQEYLDIERVAGGELKDKIEEAYAHYGDDETIILCRSNKRANRYNHFIRGAIQFKEEQLLRDDKLMIVKNCYQFLEGLENIPYIANGDVACLQKISKFEQRYGLNFAQARISLPDYDDQEIVVKVILDTLDSESASLTYEQQNRLYAEVNEDYGHITSKKDRYKSVREDKYLNALQLKYAYAITCHKSQGGQWKCVFIDNPFWQEDFTEDDFRWLYTAITRGVEKVYLVNFKDEYFVE